jgi:RNA polymerase sigma-70 factor (ECF subfamily)
VGHELILRARDGDHDAFSELVEGAVSRLHRVARLILRDDERASDAVQDACLQAWLDIRALRDPARFDAWLYRLLVRSCYREAARGRRRRVNEVHVDALHVPDRTSTLDIAQRDALERGFRSLTTEHRAVLVLKHYLGLADGEAAAALGIPPGTYKSRLNRATTALRAALDAQDRAPALIAETMA